MSFSGFQTHSDMCRFGGCVVSTRLVHTLSTQLARQILINGQSFLLKAKPRFSFVFTNKYMFFFLGRNHLVHSLQWALSIPSITTHFADGKSISDFALGFLIIDDILQSHCKYLIYIQGRTQGGFGVNWAWYFTITLLPLQTSLIVFSYFLLVNLSI